MKTSPVLAPLALIHAALGIVHQHIWLRPTLPDRSTLIPMLVIGGLRMGGSGKTSVTLELARRLPASGRRIGILTYWLGKGRTSATEGIRFLSNDLAEITPDADWKSCSDEAVLLARELARESGVRVFTTRNRERAWDFLSRTRELDVLISDDGILDPRLQGAFRIALRMPDENPGLFDLFPAGPFHLTVKILARVNCVVEGPLSDPQHDPEAQGFWFRRELVFPPGFDRGKLYWALCGLGNPRAFQRDLVNAGVSLAGMTCGPDHGLPNLDRAREDAAHANAQGFVCTAKDGIKLASEITNRDALTVVQENIELSSELISAIEHYFLSRASS